jgi:hypothetical protein
MGQSPLRILHAVRASGNDSITFSGRNKTLVLPIALRGPRMLFLSY